jgi:hypothetical protein
MPAKTPSACGVAPNSACRRGAISAATVRNAWLSAKPQVSTSSMSRRGAWRAGSAVGGIAPSTTSYQHADQVLFDPAVSERRFRISMSDLAVGFMPELEAGCYQQRLFDQTFACAVRKDHPRIASRVTTIRPIGGCGRCLRSFSWSRC